MLSTKGAKNLTENVSYLISHAKIHPRWNAKMDEINIKEQVKTRTEPY